MVWEIVGEAFLSSSIQALFDRMVSGPFLDFFREQKFDYDVLQKLKLKLLTLHSVLSDFEEQQQIMNLSTKEWLDQLKDAIYDAEDLLDDIATESLRYTAEAEYRPHENQVRSLNSRLKVIFTRVELIAEEKNSVTLKEGFITKKSLSRLPTTSLVNESEKCFREAEKEQIVRDLLSDESNTGNGIPVIAIVGMSGIGKTTLAQVLYHDERVKKRFKLRAWAYVSERCDVFKVTETLYESVAMRHNKIKDLNVLQVKLEMLLMGKKFLFVMDDMSNERTIDWDLLQRPFQVGDRGSKIIVTMCTQSVSSSMHSVIIRPLTLLSIEDCFSIFAKHAFRNEHQINEHSALKSIGEKIVEKCKGLPLAAKTLGGLLHSKVAPKEWDKVLNSNIWDLPSGAGMNDILPALRLSYYHLPSHLKRCFAYCSLFPKGYEIDKGNLIRLWIAEGLVLQGTGTRRMEEVGEQYFNELLSRSFFQQSSYDSTCFKMHDLINDLAQHIAGDFYFKFEYGCLPLNPEKVRHLSFVPNQDEATENFFEEFYDISNRLRTFLPLKSSQHSSRVALNPTVFSTLFPESNCLRVLSLSPYHIPTLDDSIGNLKHLRYLDLSRTEIERLPEKVCSLYNLETLKLSGCLRLTQLPRDMQVLTNLEHLDIKGANVKEMPQNFGNLTSLQMLSTFVVNRSGSRISELKKLPLLCGTLSVLGLQNVFHPDDALEASLKDKKYLQELIFQWTPGSGAALDDIEVLDKLRPHQYLQKLQIKNFGGRRLPNWIGDAFFSQMVSVRLAGCDNCDLLPPLGQLPSLKELYIAQMEQIELVGNEFYGSNVEPFKSLEILQFDGMPNWKKWFEVEAGFPSLQVLTIHKCPKLVGSLPNNLPSLVKLRISECRNLKIFHSVEGNPLYSTLERLDIMSSCDDLQSFSFSCFTKLIKLKLQDCRFLRCVWTQEDPEHLTFLKKLKIKNCNDLGIFFGRGLSSLQKLKICNCAKLVTFGESGLPVNLQEFYVKNCPMLPPQNAWGLQDMGSLVLFKVDGIQQNPLFLGRRGPRLTRQF